jgi:uncharacterized protein (DUF1330 family)
MSYSILVALNVTDHEMYHNYRLGMSPILKSYGGDFGYDFKVEKTLKSKVEHSINRVFTIDFPSKEKKEAFFSDPAYLSIKGRYFESSVSDVSQLANF